MTPHPAYLHALQSVHPNSGGHTPSKPPESVSRRMGIPLCRSARTRRNLHSHSQPAHAAVDSAMVR